MLHQRPAALIFDCDGTLVDSAPVYLRAWTEALGTSGKPLEEAWYRARYGFSEEVLMDAFEEKHALQLDRTRVVDRMRRAYLANIAALTECGSVAGIVRRTHGTLPLAVASGGPRQIVHASLEHLGLARFFDAIVTLDEVGIPKPAPNIFLRAAAELDVNPQACLVFEDSDTGLDAARAAGMQAIDVRRGLADWENMAA